MINLGKMVPIAGGNIGEAIDGVATITIGNIAHKLFIIEAESHSISKKGKAIDMV